MSEADITDDAVLGGRLRLAQPRQGHRVGHDAILLAAATGARAGEHVVELGAGVGAAGLALALRVALVRVTLIERDAALVALASENARRNGVADRVRAVPLDVAAAGREFAAAGLPAGSADRVLMNPPFSDPARHRVSPDR
jgi:tRNA1(Val) A37 N6-methylase TrmN6